MRPASNGMHIYNYRSNTESTAKPKKKLPSIKKYFQKLNLKKLNKKKALTWLFRIAAVGVVFLALLFIYFSKDLPNPGQLVDRDVPESTKIFSRNGELLYEVHGEVKRTQVALDQISDDAEKATIAIEDKNFYNHGGISFTGIIRSVIIDIIRGERAQGGSTITQQFVKWAILDREKAFTRKVKEIILAIEIEARFSKDEILNFYLNEIPYGRNAYGIEAAAQAYYDKHANELTLAESAYLAALPQAPSFYNPDGLNREALDNRKNRVLTAMKEQGYIDEARYQEAVNQEVKFIKSRTAIKAPHFVLYVEDYLAQKYGEKTIQEGGLKVYTTLDLRLQEIAETAVREGAEKNQANSGTFNAGLIAMDPKTGQILAMVGSRDYFGESLPAGCTPGDTCKYEPNVNVTIADRQPGSSFKPYAYVTSFKKEYGYSPASLLFDVVTNFGDDGSGKGYTPHNYDGGQRGPVSIRQALAGSLNIPAVKILALVGVNNVTQTAREMGITAPMNDCGLSLVLGGCEIKLLDHVNGYATLATMGERHEKTAIMKIEDQSGEVLEEFEDKKDQVLDPETAYQAVDIMKDNVARSFVFGGNSALQIPGREVAAKSGTANEWRDQWTLGFTPSLAAGVWSGNNDHSKPQQNSKSDGSATAAPIWNRFMREALQGQPNETFQVPSGIQRVAVDSLSGKLPGDLTSQTKTEVFGSYNVPKERDDMHVAIKIDLTTGQPATSSTLPENISYRFYTILHSERPNNAAWENPVIAWANAHPELYGYPPTDVELIRDGINSGGRNDPDGPRIEISEPDNNAVITELPFQVIVNAENPDSVERVELSIDGERKQTRTNEPFVFNVNEKLSDGLHTIGVKAVSNDGKITSQSIPVLYSLSQPLSINVPEGSNALSFPVTISAQSKQEFDGVGFYYQNGNTSKLIGIAQAQSVGGQYQYTLSWTTAPPAGKYQLYARSDTSATSQKINITIP